MVEVGFWKQQFNVHSDRVEAQISWTTLFNVMLRPNNVRQIPSTKAVPRYRRDSVSYSPFGVSAYPIAGTSTDIAEAPRLSIKAFTANPAYNPSQPLLFLINRIASTIVG